MRLCSFLGDAGEDTHHIVKTTCLDYFSILILRPEIDWVQVKVAQGLICAVCFAGVSA